MDTTLLMYQCPCCGGKIEFDSSLQQMACPFCDTTFDVETLKEYDDVLKNTAEQEMTWDTNPGSAWQEGENAGMRVYICNSCGGEVVGDETTGASNCPFCGNPVVMAGQFSGDLRPDFVIPFKLDKEEAKAALKRHVKGKRMVPKQFKDENHIDEIKGVYVPFWLFDTDANANIHYRATRVRAWSDSKYNYTETQHYSLLRAGSIGFERIPVDGSTKMADDLMESIEPFDFSEAVDFQTAYLSGYLADRYDVTAEESVGRANDRVRRSTEDAFISTAVGYATVYPQNTNIQLVGGKARYALYPVWLLNTTWEGKGYTFAMNGQTGKFVGDLPVDKSAYWRWLLGLTGGLTLASFAVQFLLWWL